MRTLREIALKDFESIKKKIDKEFMFLGANGSVYVVRTYKQNGYNFELLRYNENDNIRCLETVKYYIESKDEMNHIITNHIWHKTDITRYPLRA
jgi:RNA binding exosome subunit